MSEAEQPSKETMTFTLVKGADFRIVHATGAILQQGPRPHSSRLTFACDRVPFDKEAVYETTPTADGKNVSLGKRIDKASGAEADKIERELQIEINIADADLIEVVKDITKYLIWKGILPEPPPPS